MSRSRLISLSLLVAFVVGAVATASASEPPKKCGGKVTTTPDYCVAGLQLENSKGEATSEKVEGTNGEATLQSLQSVRGIGNQVRERQIQRDHRRWSRWDDR